MPRRRGELRKNAEIAAGIRIERERREQQAREIQRAEERKAHIKTLARDFPRA